MPQRRPQWRRDAFGTGAGRGCVPDALERAQCTGAAGTGAPDDARGAAEEPGRPVVPRCDRLRAGTEQDCAGHRRADGTGREPDSAALSEGGEMRGIHGVARAGLTAALLAVLALGGVRASAASTGELSTL